MAKLTSLYTCHEIVVDKNDDFVKAYETNLPHADFIVKEFIDRWNKDADAFLLKYLNEQVAKDKIESCYAKKFRTTNGECTIAVEIVAKPGVALRSEMKQEIFDWIGSQYSDGWGEGFFGMINIMTAPDGTRLYVD